jgi:voltage-gated potassium channel
VTRPDSVSPYELFSLVLSVTALFVLGLTVSGSQASRILIHALTYRRRESAAWGAGLVALLVVFTASIAILHLERRADANIVTAEVALWWSITTITTVGYGDHYPVTTEGRMVAVALMAVGVGLFGTLSGMAASWFTEPIKEPAPREVRSP